MAAKVKFTVKHLIATLEYAEAHLKAVKLALESIDDPSKLVFLLDEKDLRLPGGPPHLMPVGVCINDTPPNSGPTTRGRRRGGAHPDNH